MTRLLAALAVVALVGTVTVSLRGQLADRTVASAPQTWTGAATMLQTPDGTLTLCGGSTAQSLPPASCGGVIVRGLDPMTVPGAERFQDGTITTPSVRLVGT